MRKQHSPVNQVEWAGASICAVAITVPMGQREWVFGFSSTMCKLRA